MGKPSSLGPRDALEVILMVGPPLSGKTTLAETQFPDYERVSANKKKCLQVCADALREGRSIVIDNQNRDSETRLHYVGIARQFRASVRVILVDVPRELCFHLNNYRVLTEGTESLPPVAVNVYYSNFQRPQRSEGVEEVIELTLGHFALQADAAGNRLLRCFL